MCRDLAKPKGVVLFTESAGSGVLGSVPPHFPVSPEVTPSLPDKKKKKSAFGDKSKNSLPGPTS